MEFGNPSIIRLSEKTKTVTAKSRYVFHLTGNAVQDDICYFEGYFEEPGPKAGLHFHKHMTEIFTVLEGEFTFHQRDTESILGVGDTIIASPFQPHGFSTNLPRSRMQVVSIGLKNRERFFTELEKIANGEIKLEKSELETFFNRYGQYNLKHYFPLVKSILPSFSSYKV